MTNAQKFSPSIWLETYASDQLLKSALFGMAATANHFNISKNSYALVDFTDIELTYGEQHTWSIIFL